MNPMKILVLAFCLSIANSFAYETSLELVTQEISKLHNNDEVMEVINGGANFVGWKIPFLKGLSNVGDQLSAKNANQLYFNASHNYFGKYDDDFVKKPFFSDEKISKVIDKLLKKCQRTIKKITAHSKMPDEKYYCSEVFVYTGDTKNPELEGIDHTAEGQKKYTKEPVSNDSRLRQSLASNNENLGDYEVYTIAIMRNWN